MSGENVGVGKIFTLDLYRQHPPVKSFKSVTSGTNSFAKVPSKSGIVLEKEAVECLRKVELARRSYLTQRRYRQDACIHSGVGGRSGQL